MDKKSLSERDICTKFITPALEKAGWGIVTQIRLAKNDELTSLCDALENQISITSTQSTRLLNALIQDNC